MSDLEPMPRKRSKLGDPAWRAAAAKQNVQDTAPKRRSVDDDDWLRDELNAVDAKFFRSRRTNMQVTTIDPVACRRELMFLAQEIPGLIAEMDRTASPRTKSLLAVATLQRWTKAFKQWGKE